jgi:hypothetical protein
MIHPPSASAEINRRAGRRSVLGVMVLAACAVLAGGCGSSDETSSSTSSTSTTATVESQLQAKLDDATQSCTEAAGQISNATLRDAATSACQQLNSDISKDIAKAADSAKGDLSKALDNLAADCRKSASKLAAGKDVAGSFCDAISSASSSVSSSP